MFGLGSIVSSLAGGILDKIGLGFLTPIISAAIDFASGNYAALIGDVVNLVGTFTNSSFLQSAAMKPVLGLFQGATGGGCFGNISSLSQGITALENSPLLQGNSKVSGMLGLVNDFIGASSMIQAARAGAQFNVQG